MIVTHVDDLMYAESTNVIKNVIQSITKTFVISRLHSGTFQYLGWSITQYKDHVKVHQNTYAQTIKQVEVDSRMQGSTGAPAPAKIAAPGPGPAPAKILEKLPGILAENSHLNWSWSNYFFNLGVKEVVLTSDY